MNYRIKHRVRQFFPYIFLLAIMAVGGIYFISNFNQFRELKISSWWWLTALFLSCLLQSVPSALINKKLLSLFKIRLGFWEALGLVYITGVGNYFVPYIGGMSLRATYLKRKYEFSLGYFAGTIGATALLSIFVNAFIGIIVAMYILAVKGVFSLPILLLFVGLFLLSGSVAFSPIRRIKLSSPFFSKINKIWEGWRIISRRPVDILFLAGLVFLIAVFSFLIMYSAFRVFNEIIPPTDAIIVSTLSSLSAMVNITPAGLGITELVIVFSSQALGQLTIISVSVALIIRVVSALLVFAGGGIFSYKLSRSIFEPPIRKQ
jgi:uncharacterized membrane protein YbhN (UPF0104 family)